MVGSPIVGDTARRSVSGIGSSDARRRISAEGSQPTSPLRSEPAVTPGGGRPEAIVTRSELVALLAGGDPALAFGDAERVLTCFFDAISERLADGGRVELRGFGSFSTRPRVSRVGRNPRTGALIQVSAKRVPQFKAGRELRAQLKSHAAPARLPSRPLPADAPALVPQCRDDHKRIGTD